MNIPDITTYIESQDTMYCPLCMDFIEVGTQEIVLAQAHGALCLVHTECFLEIQDILSEKKQWH